MFKPWFSLQRLAVEIVVSGIAFDVDDFYEPWQAPDADSERSILFTLSLIHAILRIAGQKEGFWDYYCMERVQILHQSFSCTNLATTPTIMSLEEVLTKRIWLLLFHSFRRDRTKMRLGCFCCFQDSFKTSDFQTTPDLQMKEGYRKML